MPELKQKFEKNVRQKRMNCFRIYIVVFVFVTTSTKTCK